MALQRTVTSGQFEIACLLTTISDRFHRVSMHGVREELLERQAEVLGIQLQKVLIPYPCPNDVYEKEMREVLEVWKTRGVTHVIFGDLFLEDIRRYREKQLALVNLTSVFPVWCKDTAGLAKEIIATGFRAILSCVDPRKLNQSFTGREFDTSLLRDLPAGVDPCGENGEFHTFVYDGPLFSKPIGVEVRGRVMRDGFAFADIVPRD